MLSIDPESGVLREAGIIVLIEAESGGGDEEVIEDPIGACLMETMDADNENGIVDNIEDDRDDDIDGGPVVAAGMANASFDGSSRGDLNRANIEADERNDVEFDPLGDLNRGDIDGPLFDDGVLEDAGGFLFAVGSLGEGKFFIETGTGVTFLGGYDSKFFGTGAEGFLIVGSITDAVGKLLCVGKETTP